MSKISYYKTEDGSTGLFSHDAGDIYHSKTGALKESLEKFIVPANIKNRLSEINSTNILDICSGIGYNLKATLLFAQDKKLTIDCVDTDIDLLCISPFIKDAISNDDLKLFILSMIAKNGISFSEIYSTITRIYTEENKEFFSSSMIKMMDYLKEAPCSFNGLAEIKAFVHNIYYSYISQSNMHALKPNKYKECIINYFIDDARHFVINKNKLYDVIFLDAFSPQKDPSLWTINFLSELKKKMHKDSILVSYSKSTPFRSALTELNFTVGKTYIDNLDMGTCASLNSNLINDKLSNFDLALISTRSGITYKDLNLNLSAEEIIKNRDIEQKSSERISHTKFLKNYNK